MSNLSTSRTLKGLSFTCAVSGEVIVMHITLKGFLVKIFKLLNFGNSSQSTGCHSLSLSSGKYRTTVNSGKHANLGPNRSDFGELSSIGSKSIVDNLCSNLFLGHIVKSITNLSAVIGINLCKVSKNIFRNSILLSLSCLSIGLSKSFVKKLVRISSYVFVDVIGNLVKVHNLLFLTDCSND